MSASLPSRRRSLRLVDYDYSQPGAYFVTICAHNRACLFGSAEGETVHLSRIGEVVQACWDEIPQHFPGVELDVSCVMPNHLHGIVVLTDGNSAVHERHPLLGTIVRSFKAAATKSINTHEGHARTRLWQPNYYEHVIRSEQALDRIRQYILENPTQWAFDQENPARSTR